MRAGMPGIQPGETRIQNRKCILNFINHLPQKPFVPTLHLLKLNRLRFARECKIRFLRAAGVASSCVYAVLVLTG